MLALEEEREARQAEQDAAIDAGLAARREQLARHREAGLEPEIFSAHFALRPLDVVEARIAPITCHRRAWMLHGLERPEQPPLPEVELVWERRQAREGRGWGGYLLALLVGGGAVWGATLLGWL